MATEIGKELRKLRIDHDERLLDMAERLGKSSAFISAIEVGRKSPPVGFEDDVINSYNLDPISASRLTISADRSRKSFTIQANSILARDTAGLMARRMKSLSEDDLQKIFSILKNKEDG